MPKRTDIHKILIIGSGPIVIGQACEFDYSGTQACKALRNLGYKIVLVNSNPATIMTDPEVADATYIEPLNVARLEQIIAKERPCALLPNLGGQSALNLSSRLEKEGVLAKYNVQVIGVQLDAIERGEDRIAFKETMTKLGIDMPRSAPAYTVEDSAKIAMELGYPVVVRPAYTMGGVGGGLVYNEEELRIVAARGIAASMVGQVLIEESVLGWEELELEVIRDSTGKMITVCFIENVDPMGVHTGDSLCVAPMITVPQSVQQRLQQQAYAIVDAIGVVGGTNVQFAHDPVSDRITVIEINPRTSRSSALASKATGLPIAYVSALLAAGLTLSEIPYYGGGTLDNYVPSGEQVVVKFARWAFEKFPSAQDKLGTQMRAVGEVMSLGRTYKEALHKAVRSLENGRHGFGFAKDYNSHTKEELLRLLYAPSSERQFILYEALRKGATVEELHGLTHIHRYFLTQMQELVTLEEQLIACKGRYLPDELLEQAKKDGFSDKYLAKLLGVSENQIAYRRVAQGVVQGWQKVQVSGVATPEFYYYSSYNAPDCSAATGGPKVMILGGGPNRIGQGIEFDYCCVHAAFALKKLGFETIMVNCNPETVSTDYDTSDKLYFEPLTVEDVMSIYRKEKPQGIIVQFGGQTPLNIAAELEALGARILGTTPDVIDLSEDRDRFNAIMAKLQIPMPESGMAATSDEAVTVAAAIGYPVMVRPSYVLGGRGMEIIHDEPSLAAYMAKAEVAPDRPILIDRFLQNALECEADALCDGNVAFVPAIMQHIEFAGIHSGDSACVIPSVDILPHHLETIYRYTERLAKELGAVGLINVQYAIEGDTVYVLEANPRASRTVPLVSKVCNFKMIPIATAVMAAALTGDSPDLAALTRKPIPFYGVKEAVFPFAMFPEVDPLLGPEMRSTGEVLGLAGSFGVAFYKSYEGSGATLPLSGGVLVSVADKDKAEALQLAQILHGVGFTVYATSGCCKYLNEHDIPARFVGKLGEQRPDVMDIIANKTVGLVINTPIDRRSNRDDSYLRKAAIKNKVPYVTTMSAAVAAARGIAALCSGEEETVKSLQEYHQLIGLQNELLGATI